MKRKKKRSETAVPVHEHTLAQQIQKPEVNWLDTLNQGHWTHLVAF